jgi:hypothetical protein
MITKEKIVKNLRKYDYQFVDNTSSLVIKLDFSLQVTIDLSDPDKIIIKDELVSWNFLTGGIKMSLKNAMIYNFIGTVICGFLFHYILIVKDFNLSNLFIMYGIWTVMFTIFYLVKCERFKGQIINWTSE